MWGFHTHGSLALRKIPSLLLLFAILLCGNYVFAQDSASGVEEKLYNFDDMLIDGEFRDPQGMFERARSEATFEGVLNLERTFMQKTDDNMLESSMRP